MEEPFGFAFERGSRRADCPFHYTKAPDDFDAVFEAMFRLPMIKRLRRLAHFYIGRLAF